MRFVWYKSSVGFVLQGDRLAPPRMAKHADMIYLADNLYTLTTDASEYVVPDNLFYQFCEMKPDGDGVLDFANKYGPLAFECRLYLLEISTWLRERAKLKAAIDLYNGANPKWEILRAGEDDDFESGEMGVWVYRYSVDEKKENDSLRFVQPVSQKGSGTDGTFLLLAKTVDDQLSQHTSAAFRLNDPGAKQGRFQVETAAKDLIGILWLQAAYSFMNGAKPRLCECCGQLFPVAPGVARDDRQYCSNACRFRAYRHRKKLKERSPKSRITKRRKSS